MPSRLSSRGAMGINSMGGGEPLGLSPSIWYSPEPVLFSVCALMLAPARSAVDAPSRDKVLRRLSFMNTPLRIDNPD